MAKKKKGASKTRIKTKVVTKTRRVYVAAKRKARRIKRAAGENMKASDIVLAVGGAGVGSIGGSILLAKMPASIPDVAKNGILAGIGGFVAYKGLKKRNRLLLGLGLGAAAAGATNLIGNVISSGSSTATATTVSAPYQMLAAPYSTLNGASRCLAAPLAGADLYDGEEM